MMYTAATAATTAAAAAVRRLFLIQGNGLPLAVRAVRFGLVQDATGGKDKGSGTVVAAAAASASKVAAPEGHTPKRTGE